MALFTRSNRNVTLSVYNIIIGNRGWLECGTTTCATQWGVKQYCVISTAMTIICEYWVLYRIQAPTKSWDSHAAGQRAWSAWGQIPSYWFVKGSLDIYTSNVTPFGKNSFLLTSSLLILYRYTVGLSSTYVRAELAYLKCAVPCRAPKTRRMNQQRCQTIYVSDESKRLEERFLFRVTWNLSSFLTAEHLVCLMTLVSWAENW